MTTLRKTVMSSVLAIGLAAPLHAATYAFDFTGANVSGTVTLTVQPNPNTGVLPQTSPNPVDPVGSFIVSGASGSFTDANIGFNSAITGVVASNPTTPDATNLLAPHSFSLFPVVGGVPIPGGVGPGFHYDNLFYPNGSPQTASDYPFAGGIFDIYGLVFTTSSGAYINFWSDGDYGGGPSYGVGVAGPNGLLDYQFDGINVTEAVPEPASWLLLIVGFGAIGAGLRRRQHQSLASWQTAPT